MGIGITEQGQCGVLLIPSYIDEETRETTMLPKTWKLMGVSIYPSQNGRTTEAMWSNETTEGGIIPIPNTNVNNARLASLVKYRFLYFYYSHF